MANSGTAMARELPRAHRHAVDGAPCARPTRVLHLLESGGLYGAESVILHLSQRMREAGEFEPVIGCIVQRADEPSALHEEALRRGFAAEKFVLHNLLLPRDVPRVARRLRELEIGLIHSHGYKATVYGGFVRKLRPIPITATCHLWFRRPDDPLKMRVMIELELRNYRRYRAVVAVSDEIRDILLMRAGLENEQVRVIPNGIALDFERLQADARRALRRSLGAADEDFLVVHAGRLTRQKDQATLVQAVARLSIAGRRVRCVIAGEGELRGELQALIDGLRCSEQVSLLGFRSDVPALLQAADVLALPSLDEGMPIVLLEAAALGTPIVATAVGNVPTLVRDGVTGLVVPRSDPESLAEALARLRRDPVYAAALGRAARDYVRRVHSSEAMYSGYAQLYREHVALGRE